MEDFKLTKCQSSLQKDLSIFQRGEKALTMTRFLKSTLKQKGGKSLPLFSTREVNLFLICICPDSSQWLFLKMVHIKIKQFWAQLPVWSLRLWDEERWGMGTSPKPTTSFGSSDGLCSAFFFQPSPFHLQLVFIHEETVPKKPPSPLLPLLAWGLWVLLESLQSFGSPSKVPNRPLTSGATWGQGTTQDSHSGRALFGSISQPLHQSQRKSFDPNHDLCCLSWANAPIVLSEKRHL